MKIREFHLEDFDRVVELWRSAGIVPSIADDRAGIEYRQQRDPGLFLVAVQAEQLIGAVMGTYDGRRGWVNHLAVSPAFQGQSIGSALLNALETRLRELGCLKINLLIEPDNHDVQSFYERLGYGRDELIFMEKWIR